MTWLEAHLQQTHARLDDTGDGKPEGIVVRTKARTNIAKIRFEDDRKALR